MRAHVRLCAAAGNAIARRTGLARKAGPGGHTTPRRHVPMRMGERGRRSHPPGGGCIPPPGGVADRPEVDQRSRAAVHAAGARSWRECLGQRAISSVFTVEPTSQGLHRRCVLPRHSCLDALALSAFHTLLAGEAHKKGEAINAEEPSPGLHCGAHFTRSLQSCVLSQCGMLSPRHSCIDALALCAISGRQTHNKGDVAGLTKKEKKERSRDLTDNMFVAKTHSAFAKPA